MKTHDSLFKKVLSVFLTLVMVLTMIPAVTFVFRDKQTAHAYGTYSKQKSTEYYYASGTNFIASGILYYSGSSNEKATNWLKDNGWTPLGVNFNAGDGKSSDYVHYGVKYTTDPTKAITAYAVRDSSDRPDTYSGKTYNGTTVTWYKVGSGAATFTPTGGDGVVDLNKGAGGNDLTLYATNAYEAGPAVTSATHYQGGNGDSTRNNLLNGGYTPAQDQNGNWQDCNEGCGGDYVYWGYKSSCTTVNSADLRSAYALAKSLYDNNNSTYSGLASALTNAENTLSDLNDGYTTRSQSTIDSYTKALYNALPAVSAIHSYTASVPAGQERWYKFTPGSTGSYSFYSTDAYTSTMDPVVEIYTLSGTSLSSFASNDDCGDSNAKSILGLDTRQSYLSATFTAGTTYYVKWRHYNTSESGNINFTVTPTQAVCETISPIHSYTTPSISEGGEKWYKFTPSYTGSYSIYSTDSYTTAMDPVVEIYTWNGSSFASFTSNDDCGDSNAKSILGLQQRQSYLAATFTAGTTYYVKWRHYNSSESGSINFTLTITEAVTPAITPTNGYAASVAAGGAQWYRFTPSSTGTYALYSTDAYTTEMDPVVTAYTWNGSSLVSYATNDDGDSTLRGYIGLDTRQSYLATTFTAGTTYYVQWKHYNGTETGTINFRLANVVNVTVSPNNGGDNTSLSLPNGSNLNLSKFSVSRTGYTHLGWATSAAATSATWQPSGTYPVSSAATVYAVWKANTYTVTLDDQDATTAGTASVTATYDANMPSATMPTKTGYTFGGYYDGENGTGTQYYTASGASARTWNKTSATTLYAKWTLNTYTITFKGADGIVLKTETVSHGSMPTPPSIPAKAADANYHYVGGWDKTVATATANATYTVLYSSYGHSGGSANCVDKAVCSVCGTAYGSVNADNHKTVVNDEAVAATCTATGLTAGTHCSACDTVITAQNTLNKLAHSYTGDVRNNNDGTHSYKCVNGCGEYGGAENCTFGEWTTTTVPGCTTTGKKEHTCTVCNYTAEADIEANGHSMTKTAAKAATCTEAGNNEYYTCSACNKVYKDEAGETETTVEAETLAALGHSMTKIAARDAACTETGNNEYFFCSACNKAFKDEAGETGTTVEAETLAALGHTMTKTAAKDATCTEAGNNEYYTCSACEKIFKDEAGETETTVEAETLAALGHTMTKTAAKDAVCTEAGNNEYYTCSACEKVFKDEAGETETTVEAETLAALGHTMTKIAAKDAACTEMGNNEYFFCSACNKAFKDEAGETDTTVEAETLAALGHAYGELIGEIPADCVNTGVAAHYVCSVCEKIFTAEKTEVASPDALVLALDPDVHGTAAYTQNENVIDATCVAKGSYDYVTYCSDCDAELSREPREIPVAPTAHTGNNHTENYLDSTCTAPGYTGDTVCECGVKLADGEEIAMKAHAYGAWETTLSATCMAQGTERRTCANCPAYEERDIAIAPDNHTNVTHVENDKPATCTELGYTGDTFCECGVKLLNGTEIAMEAHAYGGWETVTAATCMAKGLAKRTCTDCPAFETKELAIDLTAHTGNNHTENYLASTCTAPGYTGDTVCECGAKLADGEEIAMKAHAYGDWETTLSATCMAKGTERRDCANCDAYETRAAAVDPANHTGNNAYEVGKTAPSCTKTGYTGDTVCECGAILVKGKVIDVTPHDYVLTSETPATFEYEGERVYECSVCGHVDTEILPKSGTCEYCGTDHHFFLARVICAIIKLIYRLVDRFTVIGF